VTVNRRFFNYDSTIHGSVNVNYSLPAFAAGSDTAPKIWLVTALSSGGVLSTTSIETTTCAERISRLMTGDRFVEYAPGRAPLKI